MTCITGKRCYSKAQAKVAARRAAKRMHTAPFKPYDCPVCQWWHLAHGQRP